MPKGPNVARGLDGGTGEPIERKFTDNPERQAQAVESILDLMRLCADEPGRLEVLGGILDEFVSSYPDFIAAHQTESGFYKPDEALLEGLRLYREQRALQGR